MSYRFWLLWDTSFVRLRMTKADLLKQNTDENGFFRFFDLRVGSFLILETDKVVKIRSRETSHSRVNRIGIDRLTS